MTNIIIICMIFLVTILALLTVFCLILGYGIRLGAAMQKEIPPAPLVETARKISLKLAKRGGKKYRVRSEPENESNRSVWNL